MKKKTEYTATIYSSSRKMVFINNDKNERFITYTERMFYKRHLLWQ